MRIANKAEPRPETSAANIKELSPSGTVDTADSRRAYERRDVEMDVTLESESNFYLGLTENLSEGGLFIATHLVRPIGSSIEVSLKLPHVPEPIKAKGTVRWVRQYSETSDTSPGIGIRFETITPEQTALIREFIAARTPLFHDED
jgi:uncharacterized protein (TIGR02266 family)